MTDFLSDIRRRVSPNEPDLGQTRGAAVAVVVTRTSRPSTLLIRRVQRPGDPWSGQVAFPGGKREAPDRSLRETAQREAMEEVGLDLGRDAEFLGYAGSFRTHTQDMMVAPSVFSTPLELRVARNEEVESSRWITWEELSEPASAATYVLARGTTSAEVPAIRAQGYVVWGLTHRIIMAMLGRE